MGKKLEELMQEERGKKALQNALRWLKEEENETLQGMDFGGQGIIYRLESKQYPFPLSIKIPRFDEEEEGEAIANIRKDWDFQQIGMAKHPEIFPRLIFCEEAGEFLIREYIEGVVLYQALKKMNKKERIASFLQATALTQKAFSAFHDSKQGSFLLRDFRAQNLLVERETGKLFLIDCGSNKQEKRAKTNKDNPKMHYLGTGDCLSWPPERLMENFVMYDRRGDFFAYGVMAYHVLFGEFPYTNETKGTEEAMKAFLREFERAKKRIMEEMNTSPIPKRLLMQLIGCMHPDPHKRFAGKLIAK